MPSQSNEPSSVEDFDLLTIGARLTELEHRKSLLTAELLSYRSTLPISTILSQAKVTPSYEDPTSIASAVGPRTETSSNASAASDGKETTDEDILSDVIAHMRYSQKERLKKLYRMTGVTTFTSQDPSPPHKVNVGIRFELFGNRKFTSRQYIILSLTSTSYTILRHSIPPFLHVHSLRAQYPHDLAKFARVLRAKLQLYARRLDAVEKLEQTLTSMGRIGDVQEPWTNRIESVEWDLPVRMIVINWSIGARGSLVLDERGSIEAVVVRDNDGERMKKLEAIIRSGNLDGVAVRLEYVMDREEIYEDDDGDGEAGATTSGVGGEMG
ncbi:hypothetical protein B9Z19DRAFT_987074 [Tuber borchii]|uniref:Cenp-O kinetochore centromere component-domain-containing protein n=1 Tax=Tuber borchii TaxID=42251 RepID=A0A2T6ZPL5_TUBBO|nr:hypothetical protein B9Z19DRAFT_987074 [Tuber borchii]